jgi:hypothetical protein
MTYDSWITTLEPQEQQDILGKGKYKLWKSGNLDMADMVNNAGRPLTVEELKLSVADKYTEGMVKYNEEVMASAKKLRGEVPELKPCNDERVSNYISECFI